MSTWDLKMGGSLEQRGSIGGGAIKIKAVYDKCRKFRLRHWAFYVSTKTALVDETVMKRWCKGGVKVV